MHLRLVVSNAPAAPEAPAIFDFTKADFDVPIPVGAKVFSGESAPSTFGLEDFGERLTGWEDDPEQPEHAWCLPLADLVPASDAALAVLVTHHYARIKLHEEFERWQAAAPDHRAHLALEVRKGWLCDRTHREPAALVRLVRAGLPG